MADDKPPPEDLDSTKPFEQESGPPQRIGNYRILQKLGEGGMGIVYLAEQERPIRRRVALKIIKLGMDTKTVIARFEAERQALALMNHPNVAKVFDAGTTEQGRPYFVMEYVKGVPITVHCDRQRLTTKERLEIFTQVCEGVQHAHQKAIIHRDLKPSNVLVSIQDEKAVPKIIDFGVAKAIEHRLTEHTLFTELGQIVGTPEYMSPEQAEMTEQDIDTRTDVYSLGVMLYELLVGALPFDPKELRKAGFDEIRRRIREEEPSRPSTRVTTPDESSAEFAKRRRTDPVSLAKQLRGDLDWITMKALEKDRTRRYETPSQLVVDIKHYLAHEPVVAGPPSVAYRLGKFVKRNRVAVAAGGLVVMALALGLIVALFGLFEAKRERDRAAEAERQSERKAYIANLAAAEASLRLGGVNNAKRRLTDCPEALRGWEWSYLWSRVDQATAVLTGHEWWVNSVVFSPDGTRMWSGSGDGTVRLWHVSSGECLATLVEHESPVNSLALSPDGSRIATGSDDNSVLVWDATSGKLLATLAGHRYAVNSVAFSPDGTRIVSGADDTSIRIWDVASGEELAALKGHEDIVRSVNFSPDGTRIASGSDDGTVRLWDAFSSESLATLTGHEGRVLSVAFGPNGARIASAGIDDRTIRLWDSVSGELLETLTGHESGVSAVAFSPDGSQIASGAADNTTRLWDTVSGELLATFAGHEGWVTAVAFSPDETRIVSGSADKSIRLWDVTPDELPATLAGHSGAVGSVAFSPDGTRIASGSWDHTIRLWDAMSGELLATLHGHEDDVVAVAFSPDGTRLASSSEDASVRLWDATSGELLTALVGHVHNVSSVAFSPDGTRVASGSEDHMVRLWNTASGKLLATLVGHASAVSSVAFSPDRKRIASGSWDKTIRVWDPVSGDSLATLVGHQGRVRSVAFSPNGKRIASGSDDKTIRVWDPATGDLLAILVGHENSVFSVAFSPDGTRIASGSMDNTIRLWDVASGGLLATMVGHDGMVFSVAFSPEGTRIASGSADETVRWWDSSRPANILRRAAIARGYEQEGEDTLAESFRRAVVEIRRRSDTTHRPAELANALVLLGANLNRQGKYAEAEPFLREAAETMGGSLVVESWRIPQATSLLAQSLAGLGRQAEARPLLLDSSENLLSIPGTPLEVRCRAIGRMMKSPAWRHDASGGAVTHALERWAEELAGRLGPSGTEHLARLLLDCAPDDPQYDNNALDLALEAAARTGEENVGVLETLADAYWRAGDYESALDHQRSALLLVSGEAPSLRSTRVAGNLALLEISAYLSYSEEGRVDDGARVLREGVDYRRRMLGDSHPGILLNLAILPHIYRAQSRYEEYEQVLHEKLDTERRLFGADYPGLAVTMYDLGCAAALNGERVDALDWLRRSVDHGWDDGDWMSQDADLEALRGDPEFEAMVLEVRKRGAEE